MKALDALLTRRTVRLYQSAPVPEPFRRNLLEVLSRSPSAADARPWHFVVVDRRDLLDRLERDMPHCEMLRSAPLAILIAGEPDKEIFKGFWPQDCAAAAQNLLLAAHALGLGACWIGLHPEAGRVAAVRAALGLPEAIVPLALVSLGYPAEFPEPQDRWNPAKVHLNGW